MKLLILKLALILILLKELIWQLVIALYCTVAIACIVWAIVYLAFFPAYIIK